MGHESTPRSKGTAAEPAREHGYDNARPQTPQTAARQNAVSVRSAAGNLAISRALAAAGIRAQLSVSQPGEPEEIEADRAADAIVSGTSVPPISRTATPAASESPISTKSAGPVHLPGPSAIARAASAVGGGGSPLQGEIRASLEPRFNRDLSDIRIHTDAGAGDAARSIGARAYALGSHIAFAPGEFCPGERAGQHLLAHELTHTIQHGSRSPGYFAAKNGAAHIARDPPPSVSPPPVVAAPAAREISFVTLPDEPELFAVPEDAQRAEIAARFLGDANRAVSVQFVARGKIPVYENKPGRAVRVTNTKELVTGALEVLQKGLDTQLDKDVATVVGTLKERRIDSDDESLMTETTLRWSQRSDILSARGTNYFAAYLQRLKDITLTESGLFSDTSRTALEWLLIEVEDKFERERMLKAIALRAPEYSTGYVVTDTMPEFTRGDVIGRFYYSKAVNKGSVQIKVSYSLVRETSLQRADIAMRNSPVTDMRVLVPQGGYVYGYAVQPMLVDDPLVTHPWEDPEGHYYWYHPGTMLINVAEFEKDFVKGGEAEKHQRTTILANAIAISNVALPLALYGLDYDVLSMATIDQQVAIIRIVLGSSGATDPRGHELIARLIEATPKANIAPLEVRLETEGFLDQILAFNNPAITKALGPRLTGPERENMEHLDGMVDVYALYRKWRDDPGEMAISEEMELTDKLREDGFASITEFEKSNEKFLEGFSRFAVQEAYKILDDNEALIRGEYARYAGDSPNASVTALRALLGPLKSKVENWERVKFASSFSILSSSDFESVRDIREAEAAAEKAMRDEARLLADRFPVMADPHLDLGAVVRADDARLGALLRGDSEDRLADIDKARSALADKPSRIWKMEGAIAKARISMGVAEGSVFDLILKDELKKQASDEFFENLLIAILAIGLGVVSAGGGTVAVLAATAGAGISVAQAVSHIQKFQVAQAASGSAFDRAQMLSSDEPSYFWLAIDIAAAILDVGMAAKAFTKLKPAAEAVLVADEATRLAKLKELEDLARQMEVEAKALEKAKQASAAAADGTSGTAKAADVVNKATTATVKAAESVEKLAPKVVADAKAQISGKEALEKLGPVERLLLKSLVGGADEAAAAGLARIPAEVRAKIIELVTSPEALRKLGNAVQESEHALQSVEALHKVFVGKLNRPDQLKAILQKYLLSGSDKQAAIFHAIGEAGLSEADLVKIGGEIAGSKSAKEIGKRFGNKVISQISENLPGGGEGIKKVLSITEKLEQSSAGSIFEKWARKHIYPETLGRFEAAAKDLPGTYTKSKVVTDSVREVANPSGNAIVEFKNIHNPSGFTAGTGEGAQLGNYKQLIDHGVKAGNGKPFVAIEYLFSNRAAAERASGEIINIFGDKVKIFFVNLETGLQTAL